MDKSVESPELVMPKMSIPVVPDTPILNKAIAGLSIIDKPITWVSIAGMACLVAMVFVTFFDVCARYVFNRPLSGSNEIIGLLMVAVVFSGVAYAQITKSHITMDIVSSRLSERNRLLLSVFSYALSLIMLILIIYQSTSYAAFDTGDFTSNVLGIRLQPFTFIIPFGMALFFLSMAKDFLVDVRKAVTFGRKPLYLILLISVIVALLIWILVAYRPIRLNPVSLGIIGILVMLALFATTIPVPLILLGVSFIAISLLRGSGPGLAAVGSCWFQDTSNDAWAPLMFFLFMGYLCFFSGLGEDLFDTASKWLGHLRGGLAMAVVGACAAFGAVVGDNLSGSIAMTAIGLPAMKKNGYDEGLSIGILASAGTLGVLIPPSIVFILYAVLSEQSIGDLFIAGIIPGILCAICFIGLIWLRVRLNPGLASTLTRADWKSRFVSLRKTAPIGLLFCLVIFGIYGGAFTATEGGGIGAFGALVIGLVMRRINWKRFVKALMESSRFISMIFLGLAGAGLLTKFMALSKLPFVMATWVAQMSIPPMIVLILILLVLMLLGCFIPAIPMILICVPVFLPIAKAMGWDLIWFGVLIALLFNVANLTPPFGINLFVIKEVAKTSMTLMYRSIVPFIMALLACTAIIVVFPDLATWLPNLFH